ncbi:PAS domain-containing sensor histidine kinase [Clostridium niameyense]|uniref:PAS domain-containing sensor histidine kinase n=1 Tax=Clostridium niameyense TaxID=1622073 RepID=UPI00067EF1BC|nr:PAS domain-containing sensor histidine kinase [Clostridium niameyense]
MKQYINKLENDINDIISSVRLCSLFFCSIVVYNILYSRKILSCIKLGLNVRTLSVLVVVTILIYFLWISYSVKICKNRYNKKIQIIDNTVFIVIFSILIIFSGDCNSQYKFLFLFVIITSTIQSGMRQGMIVSIISSVIILSIDLIFGCNIGVNEQFENDLIMVGVFILTAWPLGYYVKIGRQNLDEKERKLKLLTDELSEKDKERRYIEEILLKNEECYNLLIENSRDAILIHRQNKLIFANEGAAKLLGVEKIDELGHKSVLDFVPKDKKNIMRKKLNDIYTNRSTLIHFEQEIINAKEESILTRSTSTYFIYEGKPTILTILSDITSEKKVEILKRDVQKNIELLNESRAFNKLITEFLANISHELKTPLNVIFSAVQLLDSYDVNDINKFLEKKHKYLDMMRQNCYRLMRLINNLLDISKLDAGFLKLNKKNYNSISFIEDVTLSVAPYVERQGLNLIFDTDVEEKVMCFDGDKMERILLNLLSNAIKFTNPGGNIYVNIKDAGDNIIISVKDTGTGIPEKKIGKIFERFSQVDKTFNRNREGSGIGLYIVKSFVEMHDGSISVTSKVNEGTKFTINIPVKKIENNNYIEEYDYKTYIESVNIEFSDIYLNHNLKKN